MRVSLLGVVLSIVLAGCAAAPQQVVSHGIPQQSQAAEIVVPSDDKPFASAIVVTQCKLVVSVLLVNREGGVQPVDLKNVTSAMLLTKLSREVVPGHVEEVTVTCHDRNESSV